LKLILDEKKTTLIVSSYGVKIGHLCVLSLFSIGVQVHKTLLREKRTLSFQLKSAFWQENKDRVKLGYNELGY
jgi:hypothetical protein